MAVNRKRLRKRMDRKKRSGSKYFRFSEGRNVIRIFPFEHVLNEHDVHAGRAEPDEVGDKIEDFFVDFDRVWMGNRFTNCLQDKSDCPLWQEFFNAPKDTRKEKRPREGFVVNAVDMLQPQKGMQRITLTRAQFEGERDSSGNKIGLGIWDYFDGYDPARKNDDGEVETDDLEDTPVRTAGLKKVAGRGDALLGRKGIDIVIFLTKKKIGRNEVLVPDQSASQQGAIALRKADACDVLEPMYDKQVVDLYTVAEYFPGYDSEGKHTWSHVSELIEEFSPDPEESSEEGQPAGEGKNEPATDDLDIDTGEEEEAGPSEEEAGDLEEPEAEPEKPQRRKRQSKKKATRKKRKTIESDSPIVFVDKMNDDNTRTLPEAQWKRWPGTFVRFDKDEGGQPIGWFILRPEDQPTEEQKAQVQAAWDEADKDELDRGGPLFSAPVDCIVYNDEA